MAACHNRDTGHITRIERMIDILTEILIKLKLEKQIILMRRRIITIIIAIIMTILRMMTKITVIITQNKDHMFLFT